MKNLISITMLFFAITSLNAQQISSAKYNKQLIHEDFDKEGTHFNIITNTDNYFILDKGDYLLSRNNPTSEYAIIANNSSVNNFMLKTSIRIGPGDNKKSSMGIILKAQHEGKGAIIFEVNKKREYRIKQLTNNSYKMLSGTNKNEGWVRDLALNTVDEHNAIEIRSEKNIYDVYANNKYLTTFFIPDYTTGSCGLIISPETKARISYFYIYIEGEQTTKIGSFSDNNKDNINTTIEDLNKKIMVLQKANSELNNLNEIIKNNQEKDISVLKEKNDLLSEEINSLKQDASLKNSINTELENEIKTLNSNAEKNKKEITNLKQDVSLKNSINTDLKNENENLTSTTKKLKQNINQLKQDVSLKNSINTDLENENKNLKSEKNKLLSSSSQLSDDLEKEKKSSAKSTKRINSLKQNVSLLNSVNTDLNQQVKKLEEELTKLKNDVNINNLTSELDKANIELQSLRSLKQENSDLINNLRNEISEIKDLFIQKDFELNGVKTSEIKEVNSTTNKNSGNLQITQTVYSVQFGVFMQEQKVDLIKDIKDVWYNTTENGTYIYYSGEFDSPQEASNRKNQLIRMGYNASVVTLN